MGNKVSNADNSGYTVDDWNEDSDRTEDNEEEEE